MPDKRMLTFQQIILKLQSYWDAQGCALLQPYDMEVGAGTSHTATFLRAIGPEPWKAAYVQPSRRPKDGRYGENPNRLLIQGVMCARRQHVSPLRNESGQRTALRNIEA